MLPVVGVITLFSIIILFIYSIFKLRTFLDDKFGDGILSYVLLMIYFIGGGLVISLNFPLSKFRDYSSSKKRETLTAPTPTTNENKKDVDTFDFRVKDRQEPLADGEYCAQVIYYNGNTGTESTYRLTVEVENMELTVIHWPNGGWLDQSHFCCAEIDEGGYTSFTSDEGYEYQVTLFEPGGC